MSKYLNEDSRKHHYESTIKSIDSSITEIGFESVDIPAPMLASAMYMYKKVFDISHTMLIQIENNMYNKAVWNDAMQIINQSVDGLETIANYGGTNG